MDFSRDILQIGDHCLYFGDAPPNQPTKKGQNAGVVDWVIAEKTGGKIAHIEIYSGNGMSIASRNGIGVNRYAFRTAGLVAVRRPKTIFDFQLGENWFDAVARGQGYDFKGLLCCDLILFQLVKKGSMDKQYCSELITRFDRACNFQPFNPDQDADRTPPLMFWQAEAFSTEWQKRGFNP